MPVQILFLWSLCKLWLFRTSSVVGIQLLPWLTVYIPEYHYVIPMHNFRIWLYMCLQLYTSNGCFYPRTLKYTVLWHFERQLSKDPDWEYHIIYLSLYFQGHHIHWPRHPVINESSLSVIENITCICSKRHLRHVIVTPGRWCWT